MPDKMGQVYQLWPGMMCVAKQHGITAGNQGNKMKADNLNNFLNKTFGLKNIHGSINM